MKLVLHIIDDDDRLDPFFIQIFQFIQLSPRCRIFFNKSSKVVEMRNWNWNWNWQWNLPLIVSIESNIVRESWVGARMSPRGLCSPYLV